MVGLCVFDEHVPHSYWPGPQNRPIALHFTEQQLVTFGNARRCPAVRRVEARLLVISVRNHETRSIEMIWVLFAQKFSRFECREFCSKIHSYSTFHADDQIMIPRAAWPVPVETMRVPWSAFVFER